MRKSFISMALCNQLGDMVGQQWADVTEDHEDLEEQNPVALRRCVDWIDENREGIKAQLNQETLEQLDEDLNMINYFLNNPEEFENE